MSYLMVRVLFEPSYGKRWAPGMAIEGFNLILFNMFPKEWGANSLCDHVQQF